MSQAVSGSKDVQVLRELARQVAEIAARPTYDEKRELWRAHNSLERTRPLVLATGFPYWQEVFPDEQPECSDHLFRAHERALRQTIFRSRLNDDAIIEPFTTVRAVHATLDGNECCGVPIRFVAAGEARGAGYYEPAIRSEEDVGRVQPQPHRIDEAASARRLERVSDAIGDILPVRLERGPIYSGWRADTSTDTARLLGHEEFMLYMLDKPQLLHRLQAVMRDGVLAQQQQAEDAGDWRLFHHGNQAMCYSRELQDPGEHFRPVKRSRLRVFFASQESTLISPAMFDEFVLQYQHRWYRGSACPHTAAARTRRSRYRSCGRSRTCGASR